MGLTMKEKKSLTRQVAPRYRKANKKEKVRYWKSLSNQQAIRVNMGVIGHIATGILFPLLISLRVDLYMRHLNTLGRFIGEATGQLYLIGHPRGSVLGSREIRHAPSRRRCPGTRRRAKPSGEPELGTATTVEVIVSNLHEPWRR